MALVVKVNNVDVTSSVEARSFEAVSKSHGALGTCSFTVNDQSGSLSILPEHTVLVTDGPDTIFLGRIRNRLRRTLGVGANRKKQYRVVAQDITSYLADDVIDSGGLRTTTETDKQRVEWLVSTFGTKGITAGTYVIAVHGTMPGEQDFTGLTLWESIGKVAEVSAARFYVDFNAELHYFANESNAAPFNLSDNPNLTTTFPYDDLELPDDTVELTNAVLVIGGEGTSPVWRPDPATWPTSSQTTYGRRESVIRDSDLLTLGQQQAAGDALVSTNDHPRGPVRLVCYKAGLIAGQTIELTNATWGLTAATYPITEVRALTMPGTSTLEYFVTMEDSEVNLGSTIQSGTKTAYKAHVSAEIALSGGDTTPPPVPTGLALSSDVFEHSDGTSVVRLGLTLTHPSASDYFGSFIEFTRENDGDDENPAPVWSSGSQEVLLGKEQTKVWVEGVAGNTTYWARARSVDTGNNKSAYTSIVSHTTVPDTVAPAIPAGLNAIGGFRGVAVTWNPSIESDLKNYQIRYGTTDPPDPGTVINARGSVIFIPGLEPDVTHYFQIQAVDQSNNLSGYSTTVSAVPSLIIGTSDIAAGSITAASGIIGDLSADVLSAGTLTLRPAGNATPEALEIRDAGGALLASWDPTNGITIYGADPADYALFDDAFLRFYKAGVLTAEMSPDGIVADSIRLGVLSGGHNVVLNSSFEMAAFTTGSNSVVFTDATGTPGWKAANRTTAPVNMTESTTLTPTSLAF